MKKRIAMVMALMMAASLAACGSQDSGSGAASGSSAGTTSESGGSDAAENAGGASGVEDGVLTIAMECAYAPYNWTQTDDSNGAVPIKDSNEYANGYDVMMAKKICEANGWELEVVRTDWDSLVPGVQSGIYDAVIAGQSMTEERMEQVDFAGPYYYASIVCVTKKDSPYASATGISDLSGGTCTAQIATIWYDSMLPQIEGAQIQTAAESAPAMLMALETDTVDFICTDMPTAMGACAQYEDMTILDFSDSDDGFVVDEGEINIGVSVMKGNTELKDAIDSVLSTMTEDDFNEIMDEAIAVQPMSQS
ncbi:MAG TPA: transporter substrate-binding domain-containing protein [Candidatus Scatomonas pullistercoris]|uniref:Transporter substrate-binding domain-containing protein n=1 Tax=Candidatus Scatomonas pullistercoris TaxID=2840920 RepID=A0A9D1TAC6_9FIRM|nr:transporter substrate-binding domain-containing protein [Candidatus Scatomonas pullistercoris]